MADLISRAALLKECAERQKTDPRFEGRGWASHFINDAGEPSIEWYCVEYMIENMPAVDAVPVEWMRQKAIKDDGLINSVIRGLLMKWKNEQEASE